MLFVSRAPPPPLSELVERIFCVEAGVGGVATAAERVLPGGGTIDLGVSLVDDEVCVDDGGPVRVGSGAVVAGARTRSYRIDPRVRASAVGVHFKPGGAFVFLGVSAAELVDAHVALGDLWGADGRDLRERLLEAPTPAARVQLVERLLLQRLRRGRPGHPAVRAAVDAWRAAPDARVADVAAAVGLGRRRLNELFEREVGVPPKVFARLRRFERVKRRLARQGAPSSWADLAVDCGYFDQSHLLRDFVAFAGVRPSGYLAGRDGETRFDHAVHVHPDNQTAG